MYRDAGRIRTQSVVFIGGVMDGVCKVFRFQGYAEDTPPPHTYTTSYNVPKYHCVPYIGENKDYDETRTELYHLRTLSAALPGEQHNPTIFYLYVLDGIDEVEMVRKLIQSYLR